MITCGAGADTVNADAADTVAPDCETVNRPAPPVVVVEPPVVVTPPVTPPAAVKPALGVLPAPKLKRALAKGIKVRVSGRPGTTVAVQALKGAKPVASGKAIVTPTGAATVTVRFTKAARKALRRAKSVSLTLVCE